MADNFGLKIGVEGEREFKKALSDMRNITLIYQIPCFKKTHLKSGTGHDIAFLFVFLSVKCIFSP